MSVLELARIVRYGATLGRHARSIGRGCTSALSRPVAARQFLEFRAIHGVPLPDEDGSVVGNVDLGMPRRAVMTAGDLVRLAVVIESRQVHAPDGGRVTGITPMFHGPAAYPKRRGKESPAASLLA